MTDSWAPDPPEFRVSMVALASDDPAALVAATAVTVRDNPTGHAVTVELGGVELLATGDGARYLVELFEGLAAKVETARTEWMLTKKAERTCGGCGATPAAADDPHHQADDAGSYPCCVGER
jgi:hypothetical protein